MAETIDEITIAYTDPVSGKELVKELDKAVMTRGSWTTIMFRYQERTPAQEEWGPIKFRAGRYRKQSGQFRPQSRFNISSEDQARKLIDILNEWLPPVED